MTELHTIRLKSPNVEFELTASQIDVQKAWEVLQPAVVEAFAQANHSGGGSLRKSATDANDGGANTPRRARPNRRASAARTTPSDGREEIARRLLDADFDTFPQLPNDAKAVYTGLATLRWARDELGIDGLTISEIHSFLSKKLRYGQTAEAYRYAFKQLPRATNATGSPKIYRIMRPGDEALRAYLQTVAAGGSEKEAETAGAEAENKA